MIKDKIKTVAELIEIRKSLRKAGQKVVFTNGVFDILHRGHVEYLEAAAALGDVLILGLNSDDSTRKLKGAGRPIVPQEDRAVVLAGLESVRYLCFFSEETPAILISSLLPDILVKGADYQIQEIVGHDVVQQHGGQVIPIPLTAGKSTTSVIDRITQLVRKGIL